MRAVRRALAAFTSVALISNGVAVASVPAAAGEAPSPRLSETARPDAVSARLAARASGNRVEVVDERTESTTLWANPDGSMTRETFTAPVRVRDASGEWRDVDATLVRDGSSVRPRAVPYQVRFSAGGAGELVSLSDGTHGYALSWPGRLPEPVLDGSTATYRDVRPGTDLVLTATRGGFEQSLVLRRRPTESAVFRLPVRLTALSLGRGPAGEFRLTNGSGDLVMRGPAPVMWDARRDSAGEPAHARALNVVAERSGSTELVIAPDAGWLADPRTEYPVVLDPSTTLTRASDTYVESGGNAGTNFNGSVDLMFGARNTASGVVAMRSFVTFPTSGLGGKHILSAKIKVRNWQANSCTTNATYIEPVTSAWNPSTVTWNNQPTAPGPSIASTSAIYGYTGCLTANWLEYTGNGVRDLVQDWVDGTTPNYGVRFHASETNTISMRRLKSGDATGGTPPSLEVTYNGYPATPTSRTVAPCQTPCADTSSSVSSVTPNFTATATDPDGGVLQMEFDVRTLADVPFTPMLTEWTASPSTQQVTMPPGTLTAGTTYKWRVRAYDGIDYSAWSSYLNFTVDTTAPLQPVVSSTAFPSNTWSGTHGDNGTFTITPPVGTDTAGYFYGLDVSPPTTFTSGTSITSTAMPEGPHVLYVRTVDTAGNVSPAVTYSFGVGAAGITAPTLGASTDNRFTLTAATDPTYTSLRWKWRRGAADPWTDMALTDTNGNTITNPLTVSSGVVPTASWGATAVGADGPIDIVAEVSKTGTTASTQVRQVKLSRAEFGGQNAQTEMGPVTVDLLTGNATMTAMDVSVTTYNSDLSVERTFNSRDPGADASGPFGPGWVGSMPVMSSGSNFTGLTETSSGSPSQLTMVSVTRGDSDEMHFTRNADGTFLQEVGAEDYTLTYSAGPPASYALTDASGNVTTFTVPSGSTLWKPTRIQQAGDAAETTFDFEVVGGVTRLKRMVAPAPPDVTCTTASYNNRGCRSLSFTYASSSTTPPGAGTYGDYANRLKTVSFTAWNPDLGTPAMSTVAVASYDYDSNGRLHAAWDPRLTSPLKTVYTYDSDGHIATATPPGEEAWTFTYATFGSDSDTGRIKAVSRPTLKTAPDPTTATVTIVYGVPLSGTGAPYDMSSGELDRTAQVDRPVDATAIFPPTRIPSTPTPTATDYEYATVRYLDTEGRAVNVARPGGGISTADFDARGHVLRSLTPANRQRALDDSASDAAGTEATLARLYSTEYVYSADGIDLLEIFEPERLTARPDTSLVRGRRHTSNVYDEGALPTGSDYHIVTTSTVGLSIPGQADVDTVVSKASFASQADWERRRPTSTVQDYGTGKLNLTSYASFNDQGLITKSTLPGGTSAQSDAHTTETIYYTAGSNSLDTACGNRPEWADLVCAVRLAAQPATDANHPAIPTTYLTYDMYAQSATKVDKVSGSAVRTATTTYDAAGRPWKSAVSATFGNSVPTIETVYSTTTGRATTTRTLDGSGNPTGDDVVRAFDQLGRLTSYTDTDNNVSTFTYDAYSQPVTVTDGKSSQTRTFDAKTGLVTQLVDAQAGTFTAEYDAEHRTTATMYPNGVTARTEYDEAGNAVRLNYQKTSGCTGAECTWLSEAVNPDVHGRWVRRDSTLSGQVYAYDNVGRLTSVKDSVADVCATRSYTYDADSNRTGLTTYPPAEDNSCQSSTGGSAAAWSYDAADRHTTGYVYDALGRVTSVPASDTTNNVALTVPSPGYHANDLVRGLTEGSTTKTWTLDVDAQRVRSWTDGTTTKTNHYSADSDVPSWTQESVTAWTRNIAGISGDLVAIYDSATSAALLQLTNLHGDVIATATTSGGTAPVATFESTEFGAVRGGGTARYGWLGGKARAADTVAGVVVMGVRLYNPVTGRFLQRDPVPGGSANSYDYGHQEPMRSYDLDGRVVTRSDGGGGGGGGGGGRVGKVHRNCGILSCSLYFSRTRVAYINNYNNEYGLAFASIGVVTCGIIGVVGFGVASIVCAAIFVAYWYYFINRVTSAAKSNKCVKITFRIVTPAILSISTNNGKRCKDY